MGRIERKTAVFREMSEPGRRKERKSGTKWGVLNVRGVERKKRAGKDQNWFPVNGAFAKQ